MKITFRKGNAYDGQMRLPETYRVMSDGREVAAIQKIGNNDRWFWYTLSGKSIVNTYRSPASLEAVRTSVKDWFRLMP